MDDNAFLDKIRDSAGHFKMCNVGQPYMDCDCNMKEVFPILVDIAKATIRRRNASTASIPEVADANVELMEKLETLHKVAEKYDYVRP